MRPLLKPAVPLLRREGGVQVGAHPERRVLLQGLDLADELLLQRLDGSGTAEALVREDPGGAPLLRALLAAGALEDAGTDVDALTRLPPPERERLVPDLSAWSAVVPEPGGALRVLAGRRRARVHVRGAGRTGALCAALLAAAGVGRVAVVDHRRATAGDAQPGGLLAGDAGGVRGTAGARAAARAAAGCDTTTPRVTEAADLVVVCDDVGEEQVAALAGAGVPHLLGRVHVDRAVVGPAVLPGRTPCTGCLDRWRTDRDPEWPALHARLREADPVGGDVVLVAQAAGLLAAQALAVLDHLHGQEAGRHPVAGLREGVPPEGLPPQDLPPQDLPHDEAGVRSPARGGSPAGVLACLGGTLELSPPDWRWVRRPWPAHPGCACGASGSWPAEEPAGVPGAR